MRDRGVNLYELRPELPKFVWKNDGIKKRRGSSGIQCTGYHVYV